MAEVINFEKARDSINKQLTSIIDNFKQKDNFINKCNKENKVEDESSLCFTTYQVDENTKIHLWSNGSYTMERVYPGGKSC